MIERFFSKERDDAACKQLNLDPEEYTITMMAFEVEVSIKDDVEDDFEGADQDEIYELTHVNIRLPRYHMFCRLSNGKRDKYGIIDFTEVFTKEKTK